MKYRISITFIVFLFIACIVSGTPASDAVLILHLEEGSGILVRDSSGNGHNGVVYGASWTDGISGKGLQFNGNGDYVQVPFNATNYKEISIEFWFNSRYISTYQQRIVDLAPATSVGYQLCISPEGKILIDNSGGPSSIVISKKPLTDGQWHHVMGVRKGNVYQLYTDGDYIGSTSGSFTSYNHLFIGKRAAVSNEYYKGIIDEVAIYPRALTPDEIQSLYRSKKAGSGIFQTPATQQSQPYVTQAGTGKYTIKTEGVVITQQQQDSLTTTPQKDTEDFLSKNLLIIIIVLGCVSITFVAIIVKKKESQKIPQNIVAVPVPAPSPPSPQQGPVHPAQPSPQPIPLMIQKSGPQVNKVMNDLPRRKLKEIIALYGSGIVNEQVKVKGLLLDYCAASTPVAGSNYQKEIHLLAIALSQNIPQDLLTVSQNEPFEFKRARLQKLLTDLAIEEPAAKWAVQSWAEALGIVKKT